MVKYTTLFLIVALALASFFAIYFSKDFYKFLPLENSDPAKVNLEKYNFQDWKDFSSPEEKFKVMFPVMPQHAAENIKDQITGENRKYEMFVSERLNGTIFMVSLINFESESNTKESERLLGTMMDDMLNSNPENVLKSKIYGEYQGYPSLDFIITNNEVNIEAKTFMVKNTMYVLTRVVNSSEKDPTEFNFFINSFELSKP